MESEKTPERQSNPEQNEQHWRDCHLRLRVIFKNYNNYNINNMIII